MYACPVANAIYRTHRHFHPSVCCLSGARTGRARRGGALRSALRRKGDPVPTIDVLNEVPGDDAPAGCVLDVPHPDADARARFARPGPFPIAALRWRSDLAAGGAPAD